MGPPTVPWGRGAPRLPTHVATDYGVAHNKGSPPLVGALAKAIWGITAALSTTCQMPTSCHSYEPMGGGRPWTGLASALGVGGLEQQTVSNTISLEWSKRAVYNFSHSSENLHALIEAVSAPVKNS